MKRRILFLSGTRADFGKLKSLISAVAGDDEFEYEIFVTGMHMLSRYGRTVTEIQRAGFTSIHPFVNQDSSVSSQMDLVLATTIQGLGHYVRESSPDLIVVHGDRVEALAGAIVGALNNILVAHIEGGELSGTVDEIIRHAVSKLSHLHFVANDEAQQRLLQLGERSSSIVVAGSPDIDVMLSEDLPTLDAVCKHYAIPFDEYGILLYHSVTTELDRLEKQAAAVVDGVLKSALPFVVIYPNNDAGAEIILRHLERLRDQPTMRLLPSMRFEYFLTLLKNTKVIVGNSSAGVREAPVYGIPTLNLGSRQANRFEHSTILNVPEDADAIAAALTQLPAQGETSNHFGDGRSAERFLEALKSDGLWATPRQKQFRDRPIPV